MANVIALNPVFCPIIEIQITLILVDKKNYINTVNILLDDKIIEKIRFDNQFIENNEKNVQKIVRDYFTTKLKPKKEKVRISKNKRKQAASDIMEEFNL
jgi:hypothetical protein